MSSGVAEAHSRSKLRMQPLKRLGSTPAHFTTFSAMMSSQSLRAPRPQLRASLHHAGRARPRLPVLRASKQQGGLDADDLQKKAEEALRGAQQKLEQFAKEQRLKERLESAGRVRVDELCAGWRSACFPARASTPLDSL